MKKYEYVVKDNYGIELFRSTNEKTVRTFFFYSPTGSTCTKEEITVDEEV